MMLRSLALLLLGVALVGCGDDCERPASEDFEIDTALSGEQLIEIAKGNEIKVEELGCSALCTWAYTHETGWEVRTMDSCEHHVDDQLNDDAGVQGSITCSGEGVAYMCR